jgi:hypothetical protein
MSHQSTSARRGLAALIRTLQSAARRISRPPKELGDPRTFKPATQGSGAFGRWTLDQARLPAYEYRMDQYRDARAKYPDSEWRNRRDHWHQIGNHRVTALASNDGTVQLYLCDYGGVFLNRFEARDIEEHGPPLTLRDHVYVFLRRVAAWVTEAFRWLRDLRHRVRTWWARFRARGLEREAGSTTGARSIGPIETVQTARAQTAIVHDRSATRFAYAGGFNYIDDGEAVWATAFRYRPEGATTRRLFGMGYYETEMTHRKVHCKRRVYAPLSDGATLHDDPLLLIDVEIVNRSDAPVDLRVYEYWDVNVQQLKLQWKRAGPDAARGDAERRTLNDAFKPSARWDEAHRALCFHQDPQQPPPDNLRDQASVIDHLPADIFLADLNGRPDAMYVDKAAFFGSGDARAPAAAAARQDGALDIAPSDNPMPYCLVLRHDVHLDAKQSAALRFAFGAARLSEGESLDVIDPYRAGDPFATMQTRWKERLAYFTGGDAALQREMAWHAYNLLSLTVYNAYFRTYLVPQGSAYLYAHGADGAPRDQALYVAPLTYLDPDLARDTLRLIMHLTDAQTGAIPYSFAGYGFVSDAMGFHSTPSDLDLFFLLALSEYLAATGDFDFLDEHVGFYPRTQTALPSAAQGSSVLDHVRVSVAHLKTTIGIGENNLVKIGDGDWSDSVVLEALPAASLTNTLERGESIPNSQMALYVLPLAAALIEARDAKLAQEMREWLPRLKQGVDAQWVDRGDYGWYTRAILYDNLNRPMIRDANRISLEAQPWALISRTISPEREATLVRTIRALLDDPSRIGAQLYERSMVWPAVSQLLTWGYTRRYPELAWRSLRRHTFASHARIFPDVWINIWSGPDGVFSEQFKPTSGDYIKSAADPIAGGAWSSLFTPMTDFPVMNANQDAMALLALLRVCGVEPAPNGDGLIIAPKAPPERFHLQLRLLHLKVEPGVIRGEYHPIVDGSRTLYIGVPEAARNVQASVKGTELQAVTPNDEGYVVLPIEFKKNAPAPFVVRWDIH